MSIKKIVSKLNGLEIEGKEEIVSMVEDLYHSLNEESKNHRVEKESFLSKLKEYSGTDTDDVDEIFDNLSESDKSSKSLERKMQKMQKQMDAIVKEKQDLELKSLETAKKEAISKNLNKLGVRKEAVDGLSKMFSAMAKVDDDGEFMIDDANLSDGMKSYLESNKYLLASEQTPGSGSRAPKEGANGFKYLSAEDVKAMSPADRKANMENIMKSREQAGKENKTW